jgi:cyclic pyranopterin phosphate synthase
MPEEGVTWVAHEEILTFDEIVQICGAAARLGIHKIKLTGGEPLVRKGVANLIRSLKALDGIEQVTLTTNGVLLAEQIAHLVEAGLDAVNISLDTLDAKHFERLTRRDALQNVLAGIEAALQYPNLRVKLNCVILEEENMSQWVALAAFAKEHPMDVRFIEMMPIGLGTVHTNGTQQTVLAKLSEVYGEARVLPGKFGNGPAVYVTFPEFQGKIGFISAISHQFCGSCNRVRLTSEGILKQCLQYDTGTDLKSFLRSGASFDELVHRMEEVIYGKPKAHQFATDKIEDGDSLEKHAMSQIGG